MKTPDFILFMYCVIGFAQEDYVPLSDGLKDNVVTSLDSCQWVRVSLPEQLTDIYLDDLHIPCDNESCKSTVDESIEVEYEQTKGHPSTRHRKAIHSPVQRAVPDALTWGRSTHFNSDAHPFTESQKICLDKRSLKCEDGWCSARGDDDMQVEYLQERVGKSYLTKAKICTHNKPFSIGWQLNDFHVDNRITRITQFFAPNEDWATSEYSCIRPQYSLPLIRNATEGSGMQVQCAISRKICGSSENVIIFDLNKVFCQYDGTVQTCERTEVDNDTIIFATTVSNTEPNKYYPDQYVFCNAMGTYMSIKVTWSRDVTSLTTVETAAESTLILEAGLCKQNKVELHI
nr:unnamed protein product [Spirometra erinaceieuropaei]